MLNWVTNHLVVLQFVQFPPCFRSGHLQGAEVEMALSDTGRLLRTGNPLFLFLIVSYPATDLFMPSEGKIYNS